MRTLTLVAILSLSIGCNSFRKLTGDDSITPSSQGPRPWVAITGTWGGQYKTNLAGPFGVTIWINFMDLYDNNFTGQMNDGPSANGSGAIDGDGFSEFTGVVDPVNKKFTMHVTGNDSTCPGNFDLSGQILMGSAGPAELKVTGISGSNCKGTATTIEGTL